MKASTWLCFLVISAIVAGCARTTVDSVTSAVAAPSLRAPHTIAVVINNESAPPDRSDRYEKYLEDSRFVETELSKRLSTLVASRQLTVASPTQAADLTLRCQITELRGGSKALRLLVGFGAGKATLRMRVSLIVASAGRGASLLSFETSGTSGRMPGSGLSPRGLASAAVSSLMKEGLSKEVDQASAHIDEELSKYFIAQNWTYPRPATAKLGQLFTSHF
jgi:hypothetical protein